MDLRILKNNLFTENPKLAREWHPTKNGKLTPKMVTAGSERKVWWICEFGHDWQAVIYSRNKGTGCPVCSGQQVLEGHNDLETINPKLAKEWHPSKNGKLTPRMVTASSGKKVWWICEFGHAWQASVGNRKIGRRCPTCSGKQVLEGYNDLETINPNLTKEWHPSKNGKLTPRMVTASSGKKVWWICRFGHDWQAIIASRSKGTGCPVCSGHKVLEGYNDLTTVNAKLAKEWHPNKNNNLTPEMVSANSGIKVWWVCTYGHEWEATIASRNDGSGCPACKKELQTSFPEQTIFYYMKKVFQTAVNSYKFDNNLEIDVYIEELKLGIEYDGEKWHKNPEKDKMKNSLCKNNNIKLIRIREKNCPILDDKTFCLILQNNSIAALEEAIVKVFSYITKKITKSDYVIEINILKHMQQINDLWIQSIKQNSLLAVNPKLAKEWHPTKNGKVTPEMVVASSHKKMWWICEYGHDWQAVIASRSNGSGCPICSGQQVLEGHNDLATINPKLAKEWHPTKNGDLTPQMVASGSNKKVWWICKHEHEWQAIINARNKGRGCPVCAGQQVLEEHNDLATINPKLAKEWHPTKNGDLTPQMVMPSSGKKVWWICRYGHDWQSVIANRNKGSGCLICSGQQVLKGYNDLATINPKLAKEWHPTKNGDLTPQMVTANSGKKVWWFCKLEHEWQASIDNRNRGRGCPTCYKNKSSGLLQAKKKK